MRCACVVITIFKLEGDVVSCSPRPVHLHHCRSRCVPACTAVGVYSADIALPKRLELDSFGTHVANGRGQLSLAALCL
jgi:hypothetical protein